MKDKIKAFFKRNGVAVHVHENRDGIIHFHCVREYPQKRTIHIWIREVDPERWDRDFGFEDPIEIGFMNIALPYWKQIERDSIISVLWTSI